MSSNQVGLLISAIGGTRTFIPDSQILVVNTNAQGLIDTVIHRALDGSATATVIASIPRHTPGSNARFEYGQLSPGGFMQSHLRNY